MNTEQLIKYIHAEEQGLLSSRQKTELKAWREQDELNEKDYQKYRQLYCRASELAVYNQIDSNNAWSDFQRKVQNQNFRKRRSLHYVGIAALIVLGLFFSINLNPSLQRLKPEPKTNKLEKMNLGDLTEIIIETNCGKVELEHLEEMKAVEVGGAQFVRSQGQLIYAERKVESAEEYVPELNVLYVPRAKEYALTLVDGTQIKLNAESKLLFPTTFNDKERRICLETGEIFLEVTHNAEKPFIVNVKGIDVLVTGTKFNINAYDNKKSVAVTLVEGGIRVSDANVGEKIFDPIVVAPGEQFNLKLETNEVNLARVDVDAHTAWVRGEYCFENERLEDIMMVLARWYNYEIIFENIECKSMLYRGCLHKGDDIHTFLTALENLEGVRCEVNGRQLILK